MVDGVPVGAALGACAADEEMLEAVLVKLVAPLHLHTGVIYLHVVAFLGYYLWAYH